MTVRRIRLQETADQPMVRVQLVSVSMDRGNLVVEYVPDGDDDWSRRMFESGKPLLITVSDDKGELPTAGARLLRRRKVAFAGGWSVELMMLLT